ncbi:unnamed protein product [Amoebophrya sp. A120]|nr:unnamed protein product [Amoebophrya sp. A120]|eukprot:GSA120T00010728001.1
MCDAIRLSRTVNGLRAMGADYPGVGGLDLGLRCFGIYGMTLAGVIGGYCSQGRGKGPNTGADYV